MGLNQLDYLVVCCMCPTIKRHGYEYIMQQDFFIALREKIENAGYMVSDGYCSVCREKKKQEINDYYKNKQLK